MWILIDNYDSFTHILGHYLLELGADIRIFRNDEISIQQIKQLNPQRIIISPGPETPVKAGICMDVIHEFHQQIPILGICLGHQAIGTYFGAELLHAPFPMHGKTSLITHNYHQLFSSIPTTFEVMRYHSLIVKNLPQSLAEIAISNDDQSIMALAHKIFPSIGIQFHPESIGTFHGKQILKNWADWIF